MSALQAVQALSLLLTTAAELTSAAQKVSAMLQRARAEGRELSDAEVKALFDADDVARAMLVAEIQKKS